jgi:hypothetical protein
VTLTFSMTDPREGALFVAEAPPRYASPFRGPYGQNALEIRPAAGGAWVLTFPGIAAFEVGADRVRARLLDPALPHMVEICLLGTVMAFLLERTGVLALHASAVSVDGAAVVFLAGKESGKSSLAAAMMRGGAKLLADDIAALEAAGDRWRVRPALPAMRLWPEQAAEFFPAAEGLGRVHPDYEKLAVPVEGSRFEGQGRPAARIYLPARRDDREPPEISAVRPAAAAMEIVRNSFAPTMVEGMGWQERRLAAIADLVGSVPVRRLDYPAGYDRLTEVAEAVRADLSAGP